MSALDALFRTYAISRDSGSKAESLVSIYGGTAADFEARYKRDRIESTAATRQVCGRCGEKHAGGCSSGYNAVEQDEYARYSSGRRW